MNSLVWLNSMALTLNASPDGSLYQRDRNALGGNVIMSVPHHAALNHSIVTGRSQNVGWGVAYPSTLNQPVAHGWGENILPFEVADELHRAAVTRSPLETAPNLNPAVTETMTIRPDQEPVRYLPPEVPAVDTSNRPSFVALQEWEGVVTEISDQGFTARLMDLTSANPDEESDFSTTEISDDDVDLVVLGAIFRWAVGVLKMPGGAKRATSQVVFRRLPQWTKRDLERADGMAKALVNKFEKMKNPEP